MTNGVSKKLCVIIVVVNAVSKMSDDPAKLPFAIVICAVSALYMLKQTILDWKNHDRPAT